MKKIALLIVTVFICTSIYFYIKRPSEYLENTYNKVRYSKDELTDAAYRHFTSENGYDLIGVSLDHYDGDNAVIWINKDLPERVVTLDWYTVNIYTGKGTDVAGNNIDIMNH